MNGFLAANSFWANDAGSTTLWVKIVLTFVGGLLLIFALLQAPTRLRRPIVAGTTFLAGLLYVLYWAWPAAQDQKPHELPHNGTEAVAFWLSDAINALGNLSTILTAFLLGLGVFSLCRIHGSRLFKQQKDWGFSLVFILSMVVMVFFGYWDWFTRQGEAGARLELQDNWGFANYAFNLLFDKMLQTMDAAMFSIIAFYIMSAAYRAFRIRSVEATILLSTALIVMISLLGGVEQAWNHAVAGMSDNFQLTSIAKWIGATFQVPGLRAIDFGIGVGALAMGLRLWLSLERGGMS